MGPGKIKVVSSEIVFLRLRPDTFILVTLLGRLAELGEFL
jgi:hypothetical protein